MSKMWKLHQIVLTNDIVDLINQEGFQAHVKGVAYTEALMKGDPKIGLMHKCYDHVANIIADDLEHCFEVGNIGPEDRIEKLDKMHSISVGDILEDDTGKKFVCAKSGWEEVKEVA
jgi:hypothetical protein